MAKEEEPTNWMAKYVVEDWENFEPVFDRMSTERRVLGHINQTDHVGRGPRNTVDRLCQELTEDPHTDFDGSFTELEDTLAALEDEGLVESDDGVYTVTDAGWTELAN